MTAPDDGPRPGARRSTESADRRALLGTVLLRGVVPALVLALVVVLILFGDDLRGGDDEAGPGPADPSTSASPEGGGAGPDTPAAEREVAQTAVEVLTAWSRPDLPYDRWWRGLRPMLTPGGQEAYAFTDPARVPELGELEVADVTVHPTGAAATVYATTADGERYGVDLSRRDGAGWLAQRVVFPGGESMYGQRADGA